MNVAGRWQCYGRSDGTAVTWLLQQDQDSVVGEYIAIDDHGPNNFRVDGDHVIQTNNVSGWSFMHIFEVGPLSIEGTMTDTTSGGCTTTHWQCTKVGDR